MTTWFETFTRFLIKSYNTNMTAQRFLVFIRGITPT